MVLKLQEWRRLNNNFFFGIGGVYMDGHTIDVGGIMHKKKVFSICHIALVT